MKALTNTQRKCIDCGAIINYSKHDVKAGRVPDEPLCPKCVGKAKKVKPEPMVGLGDLNEKTDEQPSGVPVLSETPRDGKRRKGFN